MPKKYDPHKIEKKWQKFWEDQKTFEVTEDFKHAEKKFYSLIEFPYPSAEGLHVGHPRPFTAMDIVSRKRRMEGYNVLYPIGFDAFGLPTENFAIKTGRPPAEVTAKNIANFTRQLKALGYSFDWSRQVNTSDPAYYKWTQQMFLQFFKHGLAYKKNLPINWCPKDKTGLANEEVINGCCERCGTPVEQRDKDQWMLAITKYADKLLEGLKTVDYITPARVQQENWIGRSEGINITYEVEGSGAPVTVFTTRPDTNFGATFIALAPDGKFVIENLEKFPERVKVEKYIAETKKKTDMERAQAGKKKTGVFTGWYAINQLTGFKMPMYVSDFVLGNVGTGALVGVPGHDLRNFEFAIEMGLEIIRVVVGPDGDASPITKPEQVQEETGAMVNSEFLNGLPIMEAKNKIMDYIEAKGWGKRQVNYKLRDWVFSRQHYWGEPIPLVYCENCKNKKQKVLIIHGFTGRADKNWLPWVKKELELRGFEVMTPTMTTTDRPILEKWLEELLPLAKQLGEDDVIVGHSLGGKAALHLLEKLKNKIGYLYLVAPALATLTDEDLEIKKKKKPERDYSTVQSFWNAPLDWQKIKNKVFSGNAIFSNDDPSVHSVGHDVLPEGWQVQTVSGYEHFTVEPEIPVLLDLFLQSKHTGWVPLPESELPLELPAVAKYQPTDTGESPLATMTSWVNTTCPRCGGEARRETDTMPNWAGSSWYFLRYTDPNNDKEFASPEKLRYWTPVDWYNGGMEHTVLHLLYSRFWNQFLFDIGVVPTSEPYKKRTSHGMILGPDGEKMSKSRGNVINPDEMIEKFGADAFRCYIMFMGPFDQAVMWDTNGLVGVRRFLEKVWGLQEKIGESSPPALSIAMERGLAPPSLAKEGWGEVSQRQTLSILHQTIKKVSEDIEAMRFNTAIAKLMELVNEMTKQISLLPTHYSTLIQLLSPFAPHLAEELWSKFGDGTPLAYSAWPQFDPELAKESIITIVIQINGKVRDELTVAPDISEDEIKKLALESEKIHKWLEGKTPKKIIYVKGRLVSVVV